MNLDDAQKKKVSEWIAQGLKLSEIQSRLASELSAKLTYMEVRFLVDDLKLTPKDPEPPKVVEPPITPVAPTPPPATPILGGSAVSVSVDKLAKLGAVVSGSVTFSDGNSAVWHIDQTGRLGLVPQTEGYRPPAADVQQFQTLLEAELSKLGF